MEATAIARGIGKIFALRALSLSSGDRVVVLEREGPSQAWKVFNAKVSLEEASVIKRELIAMGWKQDNESHWREYELADILAGPKQKTVSGGGSWG